MILTGVFITLFVQITVWLIWGLYCNEVTYRHRMKMIPVVSANRLWNDYYLVTYQDHYRALLTRFDPYRLYSEKLRAALPKPPVSAS